MLLKIKRSAKINGVWKVPDSIVEVEGKEAKRLVMLKAAEQIVEKLADDVVTDEAVGEVLEALASIDGVSDDLAEILYDAGYKTIQQVAEAEPEDLIRLKGIGNKNVETIQDSAEELLEESDDE